MHEVRQVLKLTNKMIAMADKLDGKRQDYEVHLLAGIVRDSAYSIRKQADEEKSRLERMGKWTKE